MTGHQNRLSPRTSADIIEGTTEDVETYEHYRILVELTLANLPEGVPDDEISELVGYVIQSSLMEKIREKYPDISDTELGVALGSVDWIQVGLHHIDLVKEAHNPSASLPELCKTFSDFYDESRMDILTQTKNLIEMMTATQNQKERYIRVFLHAIKSATEIQDGNIKIAFAAGSIKANLIADMKVTNPDISDNLINKIYVDENWYEATRYIEKLANDATHPNVSNNRASGTDTSLTPEILRERPRNTTDAIELTTTTNAAMEHYQTLVGVALSEIPADYSIAERLSYVADAIQNSMYDGLQFAAPNFTDDDLDQGFKDVNWLAVASHHMDIFRECTQGVINHQTGKPLKSTDDVIAITTSTKPIAEHFREIIMTSVVEAPGTYNQYEVMVFAGDRIRNSIIRIMSEQYGDSREDINFDLMLVDWAAVAIHHAKEVIKPEKPKGLFRRLFGG